MWGFHLGCMRTGRGREGLGPCWKSNSFFLVGDFLFFLCSIVYESNEIAT